MKQNKFANFMRKIWKIVTIFIILIIILMNMLNLAKMEHTKKKKLNINPLKWRWLYNEKLLKILKNNL